jgi:hypothetical protein
MRRRSVPHLHRRGTERPAKGCGGFLGTYPVPAPHLVGTPPQSTPGQPSRWRPPSPTAEAPDLLAELAALTGV